MHDAAAVGRDVEDARQRHEAMEHLQMASERGRYRGEGWRVKKGGDEIVGSHIHVDQRSDFFTVSAGKDTGRVPITGKLVANLLERAGADRVVAIELVFASSVAMTAAAASSTGHVLLLDVGIGLALAGFVATIAWARLIERQPPGGQP